MKSSFLPDMWSDAPESSSYEFASPQLRAPDQPSTPVKFGSFKMEASEAIGVGAMEAAPAVGGVGVEVVEEDVASVVVGVDEEGNAAAADLN